MEAIKFTKDMESENVYAKNRESSSIKWKCMFTTENLTNRIKYKIKKFILSKFGHTPMPPIERNPTMERTFRAVAPTHAELV